MKLNVFSEIKKIFADDAFNFLFHILIKRKNYFFFNIFSGISNAFLELISISMVLFILNILSLADKKTIYWENFSILKNFDYIVNFLYSLPFKTILIGLVIFTLSVQIIQAFTNYLNNLSVSFIEAAYLSLITKRIYYHIFSLSYKYSSKYKMGDLSDYINSSPQTIREYILSLNAIFLNILMSFVYIVFLVNVSIWNIPVLVIIFIFVNKLQSIILPQINNLASKVLKNSVYLSMSIIEKFQALRFIYSNGLNNFIVYEMDKKTDLLERSLKQTALRIHILPPLISLLPITLLACVVIIYTIFLDKNNLISYMAILFISLQRLNTKVIGITGSFSKLAECTPRLNRTISLLKNDEFKFRRKGGINIKLPIKEIDFSRVDFQYTEKSKFKLRDITFSLKRGETTAIVGLSGSGKSSILDLLLGLYQTNSGDILIDGSNLKDLNLINWQRNISIVSQDPFLLNDSIINNLKFGVENISFRSIKKACIESGAHEFIENLPHSYNTIIGERGFKLSGGERQRISIARAFLKNSYLLILDEATSALDSKNEKFIKDNITKRSHNKITLIVAHRLSTIKEADNILVLDKGRIVETGKHKYLLKQNQIYAKLWNIQSRN